MNVKNIIYAKKFRLPNNSANIIQGLNMTAAFSSCGVSSHALFSFNKKITNPFSFLKYSYGIEPDLIKNSSYITKSMHSIRYPLWLIHRSICLKNAVIYTREGMEARRALLLKHLHFPNLRIFHEVHKFDFDIEGLCPSDTQKRTKISHLLSKMTGLVFINKSLQDQAHKTLKLKTPSHVAPSGVNFGCFTPITADRSSKTTTIGYFGKLIPEKGITMLIDAFKQLPSTYQLRLIGKATEEEQRALLYMAGSAATRVDFKGQVTHGDLATAMQGVHISVIPSILQDQFLSPLKLYESLAMGLPLVCSPMPHLRNILTPKRNALFAPEATPEALAATILSLGNSPELQQEMRRENLTYSQNFSWKNRAEGILDFINHA